MPTVTAGTTAAAVSYFEDHYQGILASREAQACLAQIQAAARPMQKAKSLLAGCRRKSLSPVSGRPVGRPAASPEKEDAPWSSPSLSEALTLPMSLMTLGQIATAWTRERGERLPGLLRYRLEVALEEHSERKWARVIREVEEAHRKPKASLAA